jgi:ABC-type transport system involved in cytochrome c biogenesis permease subunit
MKMLGWILLGFIVTGLVFWMVVNQWIPKSPFIETLIVVLFASPSVGAFWMLYVAIRFEKHPLPFILLAFIPFAFVGYYFDRVRPKRHKTREDFPKS